MDLVAGAGVTDSLDLSLVMPFANLQNGDDPRPFLPGSERLARAALGDLVALRFVIGKIDLRPVGAVEALGKNPRQGRLAGSPWPAEQVGMRDALAAAGVGQRLADVILTDDIAEALRTVFAGYDLVRHRREPNRSARPRKAQCAWPSAWH